MLKYLARNDHLRHVHDNLVQDFLMPIVSEGNRYDPNSIKMIYNHLIGGNNETADIIWFEQEIVNCFNTQLTYLGANRRNELYSNHIGRLSLVD